MNLESSPCLPTPNTIREPLINNTKENESNTISTNTGSVVEPIPIDDGTNVCNDSLDVIHLTHSSMDNDTNLYPTVNVLKNKRIPMNDAEQTVSPKLSLYVWNVHFYNDMGDEVYFDASGYPPSIFDIFNWYVTQNGLSTYTKVGNYESATSAGSKLVINDELMVWKGGQQKVPLSVCTTSCLPGHRKANQRGQPKCCFICIPCSEGEIANQTDSTDCLRCPEDHMSNERRDKCFQKSLEFLAYEDPLGATLAASALAFAMVPTTILIIFIQYKNTPVVKANNREISYLLLIALIMCCLCSLVFIGRPNMVTCAIRQAAFGIVFTLCVACVLAKTIMVVIAFKATNPNSNLRKWVGSALPYTIILSCTLSQIILCIIWQLTSSPFPETNMKFLSGTIIIECNEGSIVAFWCMLGYMGLLSCASFLVAFLARKLPDSFNETQFITFSMLVFVSVWLSFIPAYLSTKGKYMVAVEIFAILSSSTGLLSCIFLPKCYIIIFQPQRDTFNFIKKSHFTKTKTITTDLQHVSSKLHITITFDIKMCSHIEKSLLVWSWIIRIIMEICVAQYLHLANAHCYGGSPTKEFCVCTPGVIQYVISFHFSPWSCASDVSTFK
ncbi:vomeronasal type-2 receptor 26-like [Protopterus annectens]|uniref:vomeronasal type-2 receptor 26-like n=1 Tax=Protopterus annectens TaxID=7888 RepID=UPI001CFB674A|nr:vomeronasal type-2 receptor 26-like [Protopterus annectens]